MFDPKKAEEIKHQVQKWNERVEKSLDKNPERKSNFQTTSGIPVRRIFSPEDVGELDYARDLDRKSVV